MTEQNLSSNKHIQRAIEPELKLWMGMKSAIMILGPRNVGKTTTATQIAASVVSLDEPRQAMALRQDIEEGLRHRQEPILLDEWQYLPETLNAVKRIVDRNPYPNRFILTGSLNTMLSEMVRSAAGRFKMFRMYPLTVAERKAIPTKPLLDRIAEGIELKAASEPVSLGEYLSLAISSGFPETLGLGEDHACSLIADYLDNLFARDIPLITKRGVSEISFQKYVLAYAVHTLTPSFHSSILNDVGVDYKTGDRYATILKHLYLTEELPPWRSGHLPRLDVTSRKLFVDASILAALLDLDQDSLMKSGSMMGKVIKTFVISQLLAERSLSRSRPRLFSFREQSGNREIDLLVGIRGGGLVGIEVKSNSGPDERDARHLKWFAEKFPEQFVAGIVLHTGPYTYPLGDRIRAVPISTLWSGQT